ncbi:hypothetical protein [Dethiothermospora halolimnae]|uniref:hypothetical protein n=1 Tax=Dethiothermospora halolimnae TaxID=3114390 RepID=UPI003CCC04AC
MKKVALLCLVTAVLFSFVGCSDSKEETTNNISEEDKKEITILMPELPEYYQLNSGDIMSNFYTKTDFIKDQAKSFEKKENIKITIDTIKTANEDDYIKKRNSKLFSDKGFDLIYVSSWVPEYSPTPIVNQGLALDITDKIPNLKNIIKTLKDRHIVPFSSYVDGQILNKDIMEDLSIEIPNNKITMNSYLESTNEYEKHFPESKNIISDYNFKFSKSIKNNIRMSNNKMSLDIKSITNDLKDMRDYLLKEKYPTIDNYNYSNYNNLFFDPKSNEKQTLYNFFKNNINEENQLYLSSFNSLQAFDTFYERYRREFNVKLIPISTVSKHYSQRENELIFIEGFIVNKKGENIDNSIKFLDYLLSNEVQRKLIEKTAITGPVLENIDSSIIDPAQLGLGEEEFNSILKIRNKAIKYINDNNVKVAYRSIINNEVVQDKLYKAYFDIVFADEDYSDEEIENRLKELEGKINIILSE